MPKKAFARLPRERRDEILNKALHVFLEHSYAISVTELLKALDLPAGTFYRYFHDKDDLMIEVLAHPLRDKEAYDSFVSKPIEESDELQRSRNLFFHTIPPEMMQRYYFGENKDRLITEYRRELTKLKYEGVLRDDIDIELVAYMYATTLFNFEMYCRETGFGDDLDLKWDMKKYFYFSFFKYGIMKEDE